ncbi:hypothetical protein POM88_036121 [Heracleum sosnowskyi]|uniref:Ionotropic glutamate receptor C-terminal domain-containing protein n=1 Tax=Heracleum sosnowskyi TaxID=360622 RepID=A0AAD8HMR7_9APIA|nr:hypothetical protein POM88_036121 [Heracleum sosnowskyi]
MLTWAFLVLILTSSYTATLASMLTVQQISLAPKGADLGYDQSDVVKRYVVRSKTGGVDGIIDEMPYIKAFLSSYSPDYAMVDSGSTTNGFGFAFSKGSPLVPDISRAIAKLREDGTLEMLEKKCDLPTTSQMSSPVTFFFGSAFLVTDYKQSFLRTEIVQTDQVTTLNKCEAQRRSDGSE